MSLSEYEKQVLDNLEQQFSDNKIDLPRVDESGFGVKRKSASFTPSAIATGVVVLLLGVVLLVVGMTLGTGVGTAVGVLGFLVMLVGVIFPFQKRKNNRKR